LHSSTMRTVVNSHSPGRRPNALRRERNRYAVMGVSGEIPATS
jgi:hypothetical protein